jgi:hypothetical protein
MENPLYMNLNNEEKLNVVCDETYIFFTFEFLKITKLIEKYCEL